MLSNLPKLMAACAIVSFTQILTVPAADAAVRLLNRAPTISGVPASSVVAGSAYAFQPTAYDADGQTLKFTIANKPLWATFSSTTGRLSGTPSSAYVGTYSSITITVSDGRAKATLAPFSISVTAPVPANRAPTISGSPVVAAEAGQAYAFRPTAADADGDTLTYSIQNKPVWATFDATSGTLYGTPTAANVGSYANVTISVSDGKASATLPAFTITVAPAPTGNATLSWSAPTQNVDGSAITNLAGYKVLYGNAPGQYTQTLSLPAASMTSVVVEQLALGQTWYFTVKAVNSAGAESDFSQVVAKVL
jgi:hypothetical protein